MLFDRVFQIILPLNDRKFLFTNHRLFFSCKELCQDSRASIICTFIYFHIFQSSAFVGYCNGSYT